MVDVLEDVAQQSRREDDTTQCFVSFHLQVWYLLGAEHGHHGEPWCLRSHVYSSILQQDVCRRDGDRLVSVFDGINTTFVVGFTIVDTVAKAMVKVSTAALVPVRLHSRGFRLHRDQHPYGLFKNSHAACGPLRARGSPSLYFCHVLVSEFNSPLISDLLTPWKVPERSVNR